MKNFYQILEVSKQANAEEIKKAYRKLAKKYHPDTNVGDTEAEERFKEVTKAYETLSDEAEKAKYDQLLNSSANPGQANKSAYQSANGKNRQETRSENPGRMDFGAEFETFFGFHPKGGTGSKTQKTSNPYDTTTMFQQYFKPKKK